MFRKVKRRTDGRKNFEDESLQDDHHHNHVERSLGKSSNGFNDDLSIYPHRLSFYQMPPFEEITVEEFETWAIDRLKVLLEIESNMSRGKSFREMESVLKPLLAKLLPLNVPSRESSSLYLERKKDHYSHFILRLAFCRSEELRGRFIKAETMLFRLRFNMLSLKEQRDFVSSIDLPWETVTDSEKEMFHSKLLACSYSAIKGILVQTVEYQKTKRVTDAQVASFLEAEKFYKIPFEFVPELISTRQSFLHKGYAYVAQFQQLSLIATEFSKHLSEQLNITMRALPTLDEDDRLIPVLNNLSKGYVSIDYQQEFGSNGDGGEGLKAEMVPSTMKDMPLCMNSLMTNLMTDHHLKYTGRQQLSLFLKGIGLNAEESMRFWQFQFTSGPGSMNVEKFNKEYKYTFRHNYGLEGGRINYKPWDCRTILSKARPTKQDSHGCPYRDMHRDELSFKLTKMGLNDDNGGRGKIGDILALSEKGEYQAACTKVFEILNKDKMDYALKTGLNVDESSIVHPNQYYDRATYLEKNMKKKEEKA
ncbi:hypothetical protein CANARDRAFT_27547 [[Candida] arabinofermentans NRRL YB-2248]|uniref:DNA primase large subunit n=1 Tax=[Candida] arabinofermentans NRRL YB-2248 TaxID=983967 RepID=A0A1E4T3L4_9ASCO|nr:hypothetical protein CANARDRAFT_27547 [[Candida] arabinofermentans NRRL YB-2248]